MHSLLLACFLCWVRSLHLLGRRKRLWVWHPGIVISAVHAARTKPIVAATLKLGLSAGSFRAHVARHLTGIRGIIVGNASAVDHGHLQGAVFDETVWYFLGAFLDLLLLFKESCELGLEVIGVARVQHWDLLHLGLVDYLGTDNTPDPWRFLAFPQREWQPVLALLLLLLGLTWILMLAGVKRVRDALTINIFFGLVLDSLFYGCSSLEELASQGFDSFLLQLAGLALVFLFVFVHREI